MSKLSRSQYGEDLKLLSLLNHGQGFYLEIGACDGLLFSNTYLFERLGWTGILVEADPNTAARCAVNRPLSVVKNVALTGPEKSGQSLPFQRIAGSEEHSGFSVQPGTLKLMRAVGRPVEVETLEVTCTTADEMLRSCGVSPKQISFCTIDVEGGELEVLRGFDLGYWRPGLVLVENNNGWPDRAIQERFRAAGYYWLAATGVNDWYGPSRGAWRSLWSWLQLWLGVTPRRVLHRAVHRSVLKLKGLS